jgi:hypothetical protein
LLHGFSLVQIKYLPHRIHYGESQVAAGISATGMYRHCRLSDVNHSAIAC